jgi:hypothetical protein
MAEQMLELFKAGLGDPFDLWQNPLAIDSDSDDDDEWILNPGSHTARV